MSFARRHPVAVAAATNPRLAGLVAEVVPKFPALAELADRARELAATDVAQAAPSLWPQTVDELTETWLEIEINRRRAAQDREQRAAILRTLEFEAREEIIELIEQHSVDLITALTTQFDNLIDQLAAAVARLGENVETAAEAINAGRAATAAWKEITALVPDYHDIRAVQRILYRCDSVDINSLRCGDGQPNCWDPEARLYFHARLDEVTPDWLGHTDSSGAVWPARYPWPEDDVERLVWFVRSDSGMWCPTPAELAELLCSSPKRALPTTPRQLAGTTR